MNLTQLKALGIANVRATQHYKYRYFVNSIAGIVFIAAPHGSTSPDVLQDRALTIIKQFADGKLSKQSLAQLKIEAHKLTDIIARFQEVNLRVDILTVYETMATKGKRGWPKPKSILVRVFSTVACGDHS